MPLCKRTTDDPLLQVFLNTYGLNLLSVPRENAQVGDFYVRSGVRISNPGKIAHFLTPALEMPPIAANETMSDVTGKVTHALSLSAGLSLLEAFFTAIGAAGPFSKVRTEYSAGKASELRFSFKDPRRDSVDSGALGSKLIRHRFEEDHALVNPKNQYYLVTGVARSDSITVSAATQAQQGVSLGGELVKTVQAEANVSIKEEAEGTYTYTGSKRLAFGVELFQLTYDETRGKMKMLLPDGAIRVRAPREGGSLLKPALLATEEDNAFFELE